MTGALDAIGRFDKVSSSGADYLTVNTYNPAHAPLGMTLGNGVTTTLEYNDRLQMSSLKYTKNTTDLLKLAYSYTAPNGGNNGQIAGITDSSSPTGASGRSVSYSYDAWARLKTAVTSGSTQFPQWGLSWTYDRFGNRKEQDVTHGTGPSNEVTINTANNRIVDTGYSYDANGNLLTNGTMTLTYDSENRVVSDTGFENQTTFAYDASGLRVRKQFQDLGGTRKVTYIYSGTQVIAESEVFTPEQGSPTTTLTEYLYAGSQMVASITGGTAKYHLRDHLSARVTTDSSGNNPVEQGHYPFGEGWYGGGSFTTYERDTAQSDYAVFRNYQFLNGRFNRPDPIGGSILDPQSLNRYSYTRNDPINLADPLGLAWICAPYGYFSDGHLIPESGHCHYDWIPDISSFGPAPPGPQQGGTGRGTPGRGTLRVKQSVLNQCIKDLFPEVELSAIKESAPGRNGYFIGQGPDRLTRGGGWGPIVVTNDATTYSFAQMGAFGFTPDSNVYNNYTNNNNNAFGTIITQVHELGHSLYTITTGRTDEGDRDYGVELENCLRNRGGFTRI